MTAAPGVGYTKQQVFHAFYEVLSRHAEKALSQLDPGDFDSLDMKPVGRLELQIRIKSKTGPSRWFNLKLSEPI